jgi:hypothetical protein
MDLLIRYPCCAPAFPGGEDQRQDLGDGAEE